MKSIQERPAEWIEGAPIRIVESREIDASAATVFDIIADHERWPEWFTTIKRVEVTAGATGVGGGRRVHLPGMTVEEEFLEWDAPRLFGFTVTAMSRPMMQSMNERVEIEPLGDVRCRITYTQGLEPKGWLKPIVSLLRKQFQKGLAAGLDGLKARAEGRS